MANLPYLENEIKYHDSSGNKHNVCICFHICYVIIFLWLKGTFIGFAHFHLNTNVAIAKNDCAAIIMRENVKFMRIGGSSSLHCS